MGLLMQTQTVMTLAQASGPWRSEGAVVPGGRVGSGAIFECIDDGGGRRTFTLDFDAWVDMGEPDAITVSVQAGDRLNGAG